MIGIEPTWVTPLDPKSSASASFATSAERGNDFPPGRKSRGFSHYLGNASNTALTTPSIAFLSIHRMTITRLCSGST